MLRSSTMRSLTLGLVSLALAAATLVAACKPASVGLTAGFSGSSALSVSAGDDQTVAYPATVTLNGAYAGDALASGGVPTLAWSAVSGPGTVSFSAPSALITTATFSSAGAYVLQLSASYAGYSAASQVHITLTGTVAATRAWSAWLGTNVSADLPRVDISYQLNPFNLMTAEKDANGYPLAGVNGVSDTDLGFVLPGGIYAIEYSGTGALAVSGIGALQGAWQDVGGTHQSTVAITSYPGAWGRSLTLTVTNGPGQSVTDIHILAPGYAFGSAPLFRPEFLRALQPFRALRFMDWEATNGSKLANWADRPAASRFGANNGEPYEHLAELVNQTGKDMWITIPELAGDDFVTQFADFFRDHLDFTRIDTARAAAGESAPFQLFMESSNETWNGGFTAYGNFLDAGVANPSRYNGSYTGSFGPSWMTANADLMKVAQVEADRLVRHANIFRTELGAHGDSVAPVLYGWALGPGYSDEGLRFIQSNYGDPKKFIRYGSLAPYFGPDDAQTDTLPHLFTSMGSAIAGNDVHDGGYEDFAALASSWNIQIAGYEGGQGMAGAANPDIKFHAQHDVRMHDAYLQDFALWQKHFGNAPFMHFSLSGTPGAPSSTYIYGFWGSLDGVLEDPATCGQSLPTLSGGEADSAVLGFCAKYQALQEQVAH